MTFYCPNCSSKILADNINISTDLAKCNSCNSISKASELVGEKNIPVTDTPPTGSKIFVTKGFGDEIEFQLPKNGFTGKSIPLLVFGLIWLSFISFWTIMASQASIIFAAFSIPFWLVGFLMIYGVLKSATTSQLLKIDRLTLKLNKKSILGNKNFECALQEIRAINLSKPLTKNPISAFNNIGNVQKKSGIINLPNLVTIQKSISFFETANKDEQEWIVSLLNKKLKHLKS